MLSWTSDIHQFSCVIHNNALIERIIQRMTQCPRQGNSIAVIKFVPQCSVVSPKPRSIAKILSKMCKKIMLRLSNRATNVVPILIMWSKYGNRDSKLARNSRKDVHSDENLSSWRLLSTFLFVTYSKWLLLSRQYSSASDFVHFPCCRLYEQPSLAFVM